MLKRLVRGLGAVLKWALIGVLLVEIASFIIVTASNYLMYGSVREGSRVRYDPYTLYLSVQGPRPTVPFPECPPGRPCRTIWLFGGSTMRGATPRDAYTIPSFLAARLNSPEAAATYRLVNYGEDSFNSLLETKYLQKALIEAAAPPDLIIFYDGANDSTYLAQYRTPEAHHGYRRVRALIESYHRSFFGLLKPLNAALSASFSKELYDKMTATLVPLDPPTR